MLFSCKPNDLHRFANLDASAIHTSGYHCAASLDREHVFHRHHERFVHGAYGFGNVFIHHPQQLFDAGVFRCVRVGGGAFQCLQGTAAHDRGRVAGELVAGQHFAQFHLHQFQQFRVVHLVDLVQEDHDARHFHLVRQQYVLFGLRHGTIRGCHHQNSAIYLRRTGDHVFDVIPVTRHIDMRIVPVLGLIFNMGNIDRDPAGFFFRRIIDRVVRPIIRLVRKIRSIW